MPNNEMSRRAYKGQLTTLKKQIERYTQDPTLLQEDGTETSLMGHRDMVGRIERKFQAVQFEIIQKASSPEEKQKEEEEMLEFMEECLQTEILLSKMIARFNTQPTVKEDGSHGGESGGDPTIQQLISLMSQQIKEQRQQRVSEENKLKDILATQREEIQKMLDFSRNEISSSTFADMGERATKLEPIKIPTFGGSYCEWPTYKNLFLSSVDKNTKLTRAQKMHYLRTSTTGEALALFSSMPITNENYTIAWSRLEKRYDDKLAIASAYMDKFLTVPETTKPDVVALRRIQSVTGQCLEAIDSLPVTGRDPWLIHWTLQRLDNQTRALWSEKKPEGVPTWSDFDDFLNVRCKSLESCSTQPKSKSNKVSSCVVENKRANCSYCKVHPHRLYKCRKFLGLPPTQRLQVVKNLKLCQNCLIESHNIENCSYQACKKCNQRHNHLVHDSFTNLAPQPISNGTPENVPPLTSTPRNSTNTSVTLSCSGAAQGVNSNVLFATAMVKLLGRGDQIEDCRAILDPASQVNILSSNMCQRLRLPPRRTNFTVDGVGSISNLSQQSVQVKLQFQVNDMVQIQALDCLVMQKVVGDQPNWSVNVATIPIPSHVALADPTWFRKQKIDLLIGGAHAWHFLGAERQILGEGLPMLQQSVFGWLVVGPCYSVQQPEVVSCYATTLSSIERTMKKFWELEEVPKDFSFSTEHREVEFQFSLTTTRNSDGRYIVHLPLRSNVADLSNNRHIAISQLSYLSRKLERNHSLHAEYGKIFAEYLELGIIERVPLSELGNPSYYLPHHCVVREASSSTKIRIVFNASSKTKSGISLNDCIKSCPVVQPSLVAILMRFRMHQYALTCDIVKMYLQVMLHPAHKDYHRFVWMENGEMIDYRFQRVCFGISASPYLATRVLNQLAEDEEESHPVAASILKNHFYVDDCLYSAPTMDMILAAKSNLEEILAKAGMSLSKFRANNGAILSPAEDSSDNLTSLVLDKEAKTLGIIWSPENDTFRFRVMLVEQPEVLTKRYLLSAVARIFDPCGMIGPIITTAKSIIQQTWIKGLPWDTPLPNDLVLEWMMFTDDLAHLGELSINRWISHIPDVQRYELHAFCDASRAAYGAAVYLVCEGHGGQRSSNLLAAKSRISPKKRTKDDAIQELTIPKAELCGAELAAELMMAVSKDLNISRCFFWTDATVVLHQIYSPEGRREIFVKFRVSRILTSTKSYQWRHVSTSQNPADVLSRGCRVQHLISHSLWWHGPEWLTKDESQWPPVFSPTDSLTREPTPAGPCLVSAISPTDSDSLYSHLLNSCSSFSRMTRILTWVRLACQVFKTGRLRRTRRTPVVDTSRLKVSELRKSESLLVIWDQETNLKDVILQLQRGRFNNIPSKVRKLKPFQDGDGVVRVGGRLDNSAESYHVSHPIILPRGRLAELIALGEHQRLLHPGPQLSLASLRQRYWPLNGRNLVRKIVRNCVICIRAKPQTPEQIMGDLPAARVTHILPFLHTGVDFTGHISIRRAPRSAVHEKGYVAIFVCMSTKAVHLEVLTSLSTNAFLAAFKRFVSRRGLPAHIYSDNGTNFVGCEKLLRRMLQDHQLQNELSDHSANLKVQWHFNPPAAPHHGGLWEAAVRSFKHHFKRVVGSTELTYEELNTIVIQIEAVLNSRPLVAVTNHAEDPKILTPGDFLIGRAPTQLPHDSDHSEGLTHMHRWQLCTKLRNDFAKRWRQEYLHTLQERQKWNKEQPNLSPGDVVLLRTENASNQNWPLGIVQKVYPGSDHRVRVVQVKVKDKVYSRPISKLVRLETEG